MEDHKKLLQETLKRFGYGGFVASEASEQEPYEMNPPLEPTMIPFAVFNEQRCVQMHSILMESIQKGHDIEDVVFYYSSTPLEWLVADPRYVVPDKSSSDPQSVLIRVANDKEFALIALGKETEELMDNPLQGRTEVSKSGIRVFLNEPEFESYQFSFFLPFQDGQGDFDES